jgi:hypothetical protein
MIYTALYIIFGYVHIHDLGKWEGVGPGNLEFSGPQMALAYRLDAISQGPKKS